MIEDLNFIEFTLMLRIDSLNPMMSLWYEVLMMIDLMMLINLGRLVCQLILCWVHLVTLSMHSDRHIML